MVTGYPFIFVLKFEILNTINPLKSLAMILTYNCKEFVSVRPQTSFEASISSPFMMHKISANKEFQYKISEDTK